MRVAPEVVRRGDYISMALGEPRYSMVWLHGLGGEAQNYLGFWKYRKSALHQGCRVRLLQAPRRWVSTREEEQPAWYDLRSFNRFSERPQEVFNYRHIEESLQQIRGHVGEEVAFWAARGESARRVFVGGVSQGGAMALRYALGTEEHLGGAVGLSCYLLPGTPLHNLGVVPLLLVHGGADEVVHEKEALQSYQELLQENNVDYVSLPELGHSIGIEEIGMLAEWMETTFSLHEINL